MKQTTFITNSLLKLYLILIAVLMAGVFLIQPMVITARKVSMKQVIPTESVEQSRQQLTEQIQKIEKQLDRKMPTGPYIIINTAANEFSLKKGTELIKKSKCSTGSYVLLKNGDKQQWMFKTPKGEFKIRSKTKNPVWKKPDWAFVEAGLPVPGMNHSSRFEYGVLGDYSLGIGDGYLIHGTLYQRFIGLPVTHGCVRLDDANLKLVYQTLSLGSKVYVF